MDDTRFLWIKRRAEKLWRDAGEPISRDLDFWLEAEREHDFGHKGLLCILNPGECPCQSEQPTTGGGHVAVCTRPLDVQCSNRASNFTRK